MPAPESYIEADVVEAPSPAPCMQVASAGKRQGVRQGAAATLVNREGVPFDTGVVDSVFANVSKVRPFGNCAKIPANGARILIQKK